MTSSQRSAAALLFAALALAACKPTDLPVAAPAASDEPSATAESTDDVEPTESVEPTDAPTVEATATATATAHATPTSTETKTKSTPSGTPTSSGPRIVSFRVAQKPKCAEGTAVFRAKAVPLVIAWKISGATSGALSVDDASHTPGTYGPVDLEGTEEFRFTCAGKVGSTETHTFALYSVGGGTQRSKSLTVSAKILDKGLGNG